MGCSELQWVAVCCNVLQCVCTNFGTHVVSIAYMFRISVCCSVLQCVAVCCSVLQCVAVCCSALQCVAVSMFGTTEVWAFSTTSAMFLIDVSLLTNMLQCVAVCCSVNVWYH